MKTEGQVKHKLAQVRFRHLKREVRNGLSHKSVNCKHNGPLEVPGQGVVGVCLKGAGDLTTWHGGVCDESFGDRAAQCQFFECVHTKEQIREDFNNFLESGDRGLIAEKYPDMAALLWVLDMDRPESEPEPESSPESSHESTPSPESEVPTQSEEPLQLPDSDVASDSEIVPDQSPSEAFVWDPDAYDAVLAAYSPRSRRIAEGVRRVRVYLLTFWLWVLGLVRRG